jgi:hypothetical protein
MDWDKNLIGVKKQDEVEDSWLDLGREIQSNTIVPVFGASFLVHNMPPSKQIEVHCESKPSVLRSLVQSGPMACGAACNGVLGGRA